MSLITCALFTTALSADANIGEITVYSATKSEQSIKDVTSNISVITKEEIEEKHLGTALDALKLIPGISFTQNGGVGSTSSIMLRGSSNNRLLVLIDGIRYKNNGSTSGTSLSNISLSNVERIEVIKGAQSGVWGPDAASGVINIITKNAENGTHGSIELEKGSFNTNKQNISLSHNEGSISILFSASRFENDGFSVKLPKGKNLDDYEADAYKNTTLNAKIKYSINDKSNIIFTYQKTDALKELDSSAPENKLLKHDVKDIAKSIKYTNVYKNHKYSIKIDEAKISSKNIGTTFGVTEVNSTNGTVELFDKISYNAKDFLILGLGKSKDKIDYTNTSNENNDAYTKSSFVYLTNNNKFENFVLTQSLRHDTFNSFDNKTTGKIGIKYYVSNDFSLNSNYGTAYSVPLLIKNLNPWGSSTTELEPETTKSFDIGFDYKDFNATYFYSKVDNLIDWDSPSSTYSNLDGESKFKGIELSYSHIILEDTLLSVNYTRLSAKNKDQENLKRRPTQTFNTSVDYYGINDLHLNLNAQYIGKRFDKANDQGEQTGRYTIFNTVVNYEVNKYLSMFLKINNLTDKIYQVVDGYSTERRSAYVGLKASF